MAVERGERQRERKRIERGGIGQRMEGETQKDRGREREETL